MFHLMECYFFSKIEGILNSKFIWVRGSSIGIKILVISYPGVFVTNRIGRNFGKLLATAYGFYDCLKAFLV